MSVTKRNEADVGYVEIDNPPVNAIGQSVRQGLLDAVRWAEELHLTRVILSGKGRAFAAGADAREFDSAPLEPHLPDVLNAIDESFVPWIAAIDGVALGGGAEVAMACRMRIMSPKSQIGMPEVTLGVIPGAGGTQRLPRLVGLAKALDMISLGKPLNAADALAAKLTHTVEDDPVEEAYMVNTEELGCIVPTWELPAPEHDKELLTNARATIAKKSPNQIAPNRQKNSCKRRVKFPRVGWLLSTEEGLACLNTFKSYSDKRLFGSALLYYACCLSSKLSFYELWKKLDVYLKGDEERLWIVCMRVKRGVEDTSKPLGFYKDQATFSGAVRLLALRRSINFRHLHLCKCSVEELPAVKPFLSQIINSGNGLLPWFVETDDEYSKYMTQLDEIAKANNIGVHESSKNFRCRRIPTWAFAGSKVKAK